MTELCALDVPAYKSLLLQVLFPSVFPHICMRGEIHKGACACDQTHTSPAASRCYMRSCARCSCSWVAAPVLSRVILCQSLCKHNERALQASGHRVRARRMSSIPSFSRLWRGHARYTWPSFSTRLIHILTWPCGTGSASIGSSLATRSSPAPPLLSPPTPRSCHSFRALALASLCARTLLSISANLPASRATHLVRGLLEEAGGTTYSSR